MLNKYSISALLLVFTTACTQPPAQIVMKGQENFTRGGQSAYSYNRYSSNSSSSPNSRSSSVSSSISSSGAAYGSDYIPEKTEQRASISSIGISDLAPPSASEKKQDKAEVELDTNKLAVKTTVNPWTNKQRSFEEEDISVKKIKVSAEDSSTTKPVTLKYDTKKDAPSSSANLPEFKWPVSSQKVISSFGSKGAGKANDGINISAAEGEPVWAAADGQVVYVSNKMKDYGNMVLIKHSGKKTTTYAHLSRIAVDKYERVKRGDIIGYVGSTGNVKASQLFFSLRKGKDVVDPQKYMSSDLAGL